MKYCKDCGRLPTSAMLNGRCFPCRMAWRGAEPIHEMGKAEPVAYIDDMRKYVTKEEEEDDPGVSDKDFEKYRKKVMKGMK